MNPTAYLKGYTPWTSEIYLSNANVVCLRKSINVTYHINQTGKKRTA